MRVLITGGDGQLGRTFQSVFEKCHEVISFSRESLDITNADLVHRLVKKHSPNLILHSAAFTAVDRCQENPKKAFDVNALGAQNVAKACQLISASMVYISTDYVFDGSKRLPYTEEDTPNPKSIYGLSKWLGEELIRTTLKNSYIVRTSWLYGHGGKNFVNTMRNLAKANKEVQVVNDRVGSPTYTNDLAGAILQMAGKPYGTYHISNSDCCNWYEFAKKIYEELGADTTLVKPTTTEAYGALAPRPAYSTFGLNKLQNAGISEPRHWENALKEYLARESAM
jgi:dTDP-4-dehydrorhamnose reductase